MSSKKRRKSEKMRSQSSLDAARSGQGTSHCHSQNERNQSKFSGDHQEDTASSSNPESGSNCQQQSSTPTLSRTAKRNYRRRQRRRAQLKKDDDNGNDTIGNSSGKRRKSETKRSQSSLDADGSGQDMSHSQSQSQSNQSKDCGNLQKSTASSSNPGPSSTCNCQQNTSTIKLTKTQKRNRGRWRQRRKIGLQEDEEYANDEIEIPGYYYDKEKKKYFKIQPNYSTVSGTVTKEVIKEIQVEKKRQEDLLTYSAGDFKSLLFNTTSNRKSIKSDNVFSPIMNRQYGLQSSIITNNTLDQYLIKKFVPRAKVSAIQEFYSGLGIQKLEDTRHFMLSRDSKKFIGVWSLNNILGQRMHHGNFHMTKKVGTEGDISVGMSKTYRVHTFGRGRVTCLQWAPQSPDEMNTSRYLYAESAYLRDKNSIVHLVDTRDEMNYFDFGPKMIWSCAWDSCGSQLSIGNDECSMLVDTPTRSMWELRTNNSAVLAQKFSQNGMQLFSGNKRGQVLCHDLRSRSTIAVYTLKHKLNISSLYQSRNDNTLIIGDVSGKIKKWDLRKRQVLHTYPGQVNEYIHLPFHVDQRERFLYAVGEDCYTRLWSYKTGELLHTIPSPCPVSISNIPIVALTENLGGPGGLPCLVMAVQKEIHVYTY